MPIPQFLELYKALLELMPEDERIAKNEVLFILDRNHGGWKG